MPCCCAQSRGAAPCSGSVGSSWQRPLPPAALPPPGRRRRSSPVLQPPRALPELASSSMLPLVAVLADAAGAQLDPALAPYTFEPQMRPEIVVAAAVAAAPPIIFWARIFLSAQRRQRAIDEAKAEEERRQREREELKRKITGQAPPTEQ